MEDGLVEQKLSSTFMNSQGVEKSLDEEKSLWKILSEISRNLLETRLNKHEARKA